MKHSRNQFLRKIRRGGIPHMVLKSDVITSGSVPKKATFFTQRNHISLIHTYLFMGHKLNLSLHIWQHSREDWPWFLQWKPHQCCTSVAKVKNKTCPETQIDDTSKLDIIS